MGGHAPAVLAEHLGDRREDLRRDGIDPVVGPAAAHGPNEWLRHEAALETAVDAKLHAADTDPFVAFILLERGARQDLTHRLNVAHANAGAGCGKVDVEAYRQ